MKRFLLLISFAATASGAVAETLTVATVNTWSGLTYQGVFQVGEYEDRATRTFRFGLLADALLAIRPDVIALQEANPLPRYAEELAERLPGYDSVAAVRQAGVRVGPVGLPANLREGELLLADRARGLTRTAARQLAGPGAGDVAAFQLGSGTQMLAGRVQVGDRAVHLFTTRWTPSPQADRNRLVGLVDQYVSGSLEGDELARLVGEAVRGSERRRQEARESVAFINETAGREPVILMGSLFALPDSEEIRVLREAGFVDVWAAVGPSAGYTFDATSNANIIQHDLASHPGERARYDYIFIRGDGIVARSARIILATPTYGVHPSAHYGIYAEIRIDP